MTDLGLLTVLPLSYYLAILLLSASFILASSEDNASPVMLSLHVIALIIMIHGTPQIVYGTVRYSWAWKHVGIIDYIQRNHSVNPNITYLNVYHDWPGFFALGAFLTQVAGFQSALSYAGWGPLFFNLIDFPALLVIFRSITKDRRLIWLAAWFFYITNWIGQDYFSPQAMNYFLYLVVIGIVLSWFSIWSPPNPEFISKWLKSRLLSGGFSRLLSRGIPAGTKISTPKQRAMLMVFLGAIFFVIASSHQLTPFMMISALTLLTIFQVSRARSLPFMMAIFTAAWVIFMGETFLQGNIGWITRSIGLLTGNFAANIHNLQQASPGQVVVSWMDRGLSALVGILAIFGALRRLRNGKWDLASILLILAPLPMVPANAYGGEMVFRVYYFALPFMAFLGASNFYPSIEKGRNIDTVLAAIGLSVVLLFGFFFGYYGKDQMYYFSPEEVQASEYLHTNAPPGSMIMSGTVDWPLGYKNYEFYNYLAISNLPKIQQDQLFRDPVNRILIDMRGNTSAYFVITRSQIAEVDTIGMLPKGSLSQLGSLLLKSQNFKLIYSNSDALIFERVNSLGVK
jgi:hypothetical protein